MIDIDRIKADFLKQIIYMLNSTYNESESMRDDEAQAWIEPLEAFENLVMQRYGYLIGEDSGEQD